MKVKWFNESDKYNPLKQIGKRPSEEEVESWRPRDCYECERYNKRYRIIRIAPIIRVIYRPSMYSFSRNIIEVY